jgi:hypothetical protein
LSLGIDNKEFGWKLHLCLRSSKSVQDDTLASTCRTYHHSCVACEHGLIQLDHLVHLLCRRHHHQKPIFLVKLFSKIQIMNMMSSYY